MIFFIPCPSSLDRQSKHNSIIKIEYYLVWTFHALQEDHLIYSDTTLIIII